MGVNKQVTSTTSALLVSLSLKVLIDQVTAVVTGDTWPHQERGMKGVIRAHVQVGREEVCTCAWRRERARIPFQRAGVWMCAHKQRREHHQGPAITRNAPTSGSGLQSCSTNESRPPPNPLRERLSSWTSA